MKKKIFTFMMALTLAFTGLANAQNVVEVGTGTETSTVGPFCSIWGYSFEEVLYPASEIGTAGTITHIAYHLQSTETYHNDVVIYMKNVDRTVFGSPADVVPVTTADIVYEGAFDYPTTDGWYTLELGTPFEYDGTSTLMIAFDENTDGYYSRQFYYTDVPGSCVNFYSDSENPDPYNLGAYSGGSMVDNKMVNIRLTFGNGCVPGAPIRGEYVWNSTDDCGALISWDGAPVPPIENTFTEDFEGGLGIFTSIDQDGDGYGWRHNTELSGLSNGGHNGSAGFVLSQSYDNGYGALTPDNYLVSPQVGLTNGSTFSFWACAQDENWASEHFGVAVSATGTPGSFETIQEWTLTAKGARHDGERGLRQGSWHQCTVDLSAYAGQSMYIAVRHFNTTNMFSIDLDDAELSIGTKSDRAAEIVKYNVYRSTDNANYELIGSVDAVEGATYYEYFDDEVPADMYYYQVRAYYSNGCESEPAASEANPANNYVIVVVTSVAENGEVALYPNPTNGNVTINAQNMNRITVVSALGQVVYDAEVEGDEQIINMAQFNAGVYMVRIATENGVSTQRVTVVK